MDDVRNISEIEDSLAIATNDWNRIVNAAKKTGYREGIESGSNDIFQTGFDKGYEDGFKTAFILGKFKSLLYTMPRDAKHPQNINEILDKTRRGACNICMTESHNASENVQKSFLQIVDQQRTHSMKLIQILHEYFQPYKKQLNVNESNILEI